MIIDPNNLPGPQDMYPPPDPNAKRFRIPRVVAYFLLFWVIILFFALMQWLFD